MKKVLTLSLLCILFSGCASTTKLTPESDQNISKVYINKDVKTPETAYYYGPGQRVSGVNALVAQAAKTNDKLKLKVNDLIVIYMRANGIDIGEICKNAVKDALLKTPKLATKQLVTNAEDADTYLTVDVVIYGVARRPGFSNTYGIQLGVKAKLTDTNNTVIWEDYEFITPMNNDVEAIEFNEYFKDPANMQIRYEKAADIVASLMSEDL